VKITALALLVFVFALALARGSDAKVLYSNPGDNITGFDLMYGNPCFSVDPQHDLLGASGGGWFALPVVLTGDFQLDFDVYGDSGDVDSDIIFADDQTGAGIEVNDCPQNTDTPTINIKWSANLCTHQSFYFDLTTLASAPSTNFPNFTWTHIRITKKGNTLTDNVGGQVILADVSNGKFPTEARLGLGYYSTQNLGGAGLIRYAHIRVIQLSTENPVPEETAPATRGGMD
jgi:hypothetical protein